MHEDFNCTGPWPGVDWRVCARSSSLLSDSESISKDYVVIFTDNDNMYLPVTWLVAGVSGPENTVSASESFSPSAIL